MKTEQSLHQELVQRLLALTQENRLVWKESVLEDAFEVAFPEYSLRIRPASRYTDTGYIIEIINLAGNTIETIGATFEPGLHTPLEELYEIARRKALRTDEVLRDLLHSLEQMGEKSS